MIAICVGSMSAGCSCQRTPKPSTATVIPANEAAAHINECAQKNYRLSPHLALIKDHEADAFSRNGLISLEVDNFCPFLQRNCVSGIHKVRRFNDRPACVLGLVFTVQNLAEPVQIESGDVVIALPL